MKYEGLGLGSMSNVSTISICTHTASWPLQLFVLHSKSEQVDLGPHPPIHRNPIPSLKETQDMPPEMGSENPFSPPHSSKLGQALDPAMYFSVS